MRSASRGGQRRLAKEAKWFNCREEAAEAELAAIATEGPRYNVRGPARTRIHSTHFRFLDQSLAEDATTVATVDGMSLNETIRVAIVNYLGKRKADPAFRSALRRHIGKAQRLLEGDAA